MSSGALGCTRRYAAGTGRTSQPRRGSALAEALARRGERVADAARARGRRGRRRSRPRWPAAATVPSRTRCGDTARAPRGTGRPPRTSASAASVASSERIGTPRRQPLAVDLEPADEHGQRARAESRTSRRVANTGALSSCRSRSYASGRPFTVASRPDEPSDRGARLPPRELRNIRVQLLRHHRRARRRPSGSRTKPNYGDDQSTSSSPNRERCTNSTVAA